MEMRSKAVRTGSPEDAATDASTLGLRGLEGGEGQTPLAVQHAARPLSGPPPPGRTRWAVHFWLAELLHAVASLLDKINQGESAAAAEDEQAEPLVAAASTIAAGVPAENSNTSAIGPDQSGGGESSTPRLDSGATISTVRDVVASSTLLLPGKKSTVQQRLPVLR
ncbi:unnamed protein product [Lampetra planeri]